MGVSLRRATDNLTDLVRGVTTDQLDRPTPCPDYTVADILDHIAGLSLAFTGAARKEPDLAPSGPMVDGSRLPDDWQDVIPVRLADLAGAWDDPGAWIGTAAAGGVTMPAEIAGMVTLDEVLIHSWDLAKATGQQFRADPADLAVLHDFLAAAAEPGQEAQRDGMFGPVVGVAPHRQLVDKLVGLAGRRPDWSPPGS